MLAWVLMLKSEVAQLHLDLQRRKAADSTALAQAWAAQAQAIDHAVMDERRREARETVRTRVLTQEVQRTDDYQAPLDESLRVLLNGLSGYASKARGQGFVPAGTGLPARAGTDAR